MSFPIFIGKDEGIILIPLLELTLTYGSSISTIVNLHHPNENNDVSLKFNIYSIIINAFFLIVFLFIIFELKKTDEKLKTWQRIFWIFILIFCITTNGFNLYLLENLKKEIRKENVGPSCPSIENCKKISGIMGNTALGLNIGNISLFSIFLISLYFSRDLFMRKKKG